MSSDDRIIDLLTEWDEQRRAGREMTAAQLCPDDPELAAELATRLARWNGLRVFFDDPTPLLPTEPAAPTVPDIAGYRIIEVIGSGGMGVVYKAEDQKLGRIVALKMVLAGPNVDGEHLSRFRTEAGAIAALQHPHIVQIFEIGAAAGRPYLALEFAAGGTLAQLLRGTPLPARRAAEILAPLADAVEHAHRHGVIHRDLKPANVLIAADGQPKIADFGLAKRLDDETGPTRTGVVLGSPNYMAPEQAAGDPERVGTSSDIYSLGAILYELLTGRPPFQAARALEVMHRVLHETAVPPSRLTAGLPRDLETICLKCLEKEPRRRYASAGDLAEDLHRFLAGVPVRARPISRADRLQRWARRRPAVAGLSAALIAVAVLGVAGIVWQWRRAVQEAHDVQAERDVARRQRDRAEANSEQARLAVERMTEAATLLFRRNQDKEGQALLEEAVKFHEAFVADRGDDPAVLLRAAQAWDRVAELDRELGKWPEMHDATHRAADLYTQLRELFPDDVSYQLGWVNATRRDANLYRWERKLAEAEAAYERVLRVNREMLAANPNDRRLHVHLAATLTSWGGLLVEFHHYARAEPLLNEAADLLEALVAADSTQHGYLVELAATLDLISRLPQVSTASERNVQSGARALAIRRKLVAANPDSIEDRRYLYISERNLGERAFHKSAFVDAETHLTAALAELAVLHEKQPRYGPWVSTRLTCQRDLIFVQYQLGRPKDAVATFAEAEQTAKEALLVNPTEGARIAFDLATCQAYAALALVDIGQTPRALEVALQAEKSERATVRNTLAWFYSIARDPKARNADRALRLARLVIEERDSAATYWNTLSLALYRADKYDEAFAALTKAGGLRGSHDHNDHYLLALIEFRRGNRDQARKHLHEGQRLAAQQGAIERDAQLLRDEAEVLLQLK